MKEICLAFDAFGQWFEHKRNKMSDSPIRALESTTLRSWRAGQTWATVSPCVESLL
jgi:hypothetical protein